MELLLRVPAPAPCHGPGCCFAACLSSPPPPTTSPPAARRCESAVRDLGKQGSAGRLDRSSSAWASTRGWAGGRAVGGAGGVGSLAGSSAGSGVWLLMLDPRPLFTSREVQASRAWGPTAPGSSPNPRPSPRSARLLLPARALRHRCVQPDRGRGSPFALGGSCETAVGGPPETVGQLAASSTNSPGGGSVKADVPLRTLDCVTSPIVPPFESSPPLHCGLCASVPASPAELLAIGCDALVVCRLAYRCCCRRSASWVEVGTSQMGTWVRARVACRGPRRYTFTSPTSSLLRLLAQDSTPS
ncbi:hypothetical protein V8C86DRAFT_2474061, partial [Haematococcus lacustris]